MHVTQTLLALDAAQSAQPDRADELRRLLETAYTRQLDASELGEIAYISARAYGPTYAALNRDPGHLRRLCDVAVASVAGSHALRREITVHAFMRLRQLAEYELAFYAADCGIRIAEASRDRREIVRAQVCRVAASADALDYRTTLTYYTATRELAQEIDDQDSVMGLRYIMGRLHFYTGHYDEATRYLKSVLEISEKLDPADLYWVGTAGRAATILAYALHNVGNNEAAQTTIEKALTLPIVSHSLDATQHDTAYREMVACLIAARAGLSSAATHANAAERLATDHPIPPLVARATICKAAIALQSGTFDAAADLLAPLYDHRPRRSFYWVDTAHLLLEVCGAAGRRDEANQVREALIQAQRDMATARITVTPDQLNRGMLPASSHASSLRAELAMPAAPFHPTAEAHRSSLAAARNSARIAHVHAQIGAQHPILVSGLARLVAFWFGYAEDTANEIAIAAELANLGYLTQARASASVLDILEPIDHDLALQHVSHGSRIAQSMVGLTDNQFVLPAISQHHAWWDGTGYPPNLAAGAIHPAARITALANTYVSLTHSTPWRQARSPNEALDFMLGRSGTQFSSEELGRFVELVRKLILDHGENLDSYLTEVSARVL